MYDKMIRNTGLAALLILVLVTVVTTLFANGKKQVYVEKTNTEVNMQEQMQEQAELELNTKKELTIQTMEEGEADLCISVSDKNIETDIVAKSEYRNHILYLQIENIGQGFFDQNPIQAKEGYVETVFCEYLKNTAKLEIQLSNVYEYNIVFKNNMLYITFSKPRENYDKIVIIDAAYGGDEIGINTSELLEKDLTLSVAKRVKNLLENSSIRVYLTRMEDETVTKEERIKFVSEIEPDMFVSIRADDINGIIVKGISSYYNGQYFIPFFGNIQLADYLEYYTLKETGAEIGGILPIEEDSVLTGVEVPSAIINVGHLLNPSETEKLMQDEYVEKIAVGIYNGIIESYSVMDSVTKK